MKATGQKTILPATGDCVTAKVEVVNQRYAKCSIICIGDVLLNRPLRGMLRKEDVRATDIDRVEMYKNYRPGDIILAKIVRSESHCESRDATNSFIISASSN